MTKILLILNAILMLILVAMLTTRQARNISPPDERSKIESAQDEIVDDGEKMTEGPIKEESTGENGTQQQMSEKPKTSNTPTTPKQTAPSASGVATHDEQGRPIVRYYFSGFSPTLIEIKAGQSVRFINASYGTMWLKTSGEPNAPDFLPEFDTGRSLPPGEEFIFTFTKLGTWGYKNMNHKQHEGAIVVQPQ